MRASGLLLLDFEHLEDWCRKVRHVFRATPYLVGSALVNPDFRDVDVRVILSDERFDATFAGDPRRVRYLNQALSSWGQRETCLPIDFQVQRQTEANAQYGDRTRNPMGSRDWDSIPTSGVPS